MDKTDSESPSVNPSDKSKRLDLKITVSFQDKNRSIEVTDKELPKPIRPEPKKENGKEVEPNFDPKVLPPPPKIIGTSANTRTRQNQVT